MKKLVLKSGKEKSLLRKHPWIFSGAIHHAEGSPDNGDTVQVYAPDGKFLALAAYNPQSKISARIWSQDEKETIGAEFFRRRITDALAARDNLNRPSTGNSMRLIHAESDRLPGLIVDRYGDVLVMQVGSAGAERWRDVIADTLQEQCKPVCIYERSDSDSRALEGLEQRNGVLRGNLPDNVEVIEHGLHFKVDVAAGQKTGFYLDQRDKRPVSISISATTAR